MSPGFPHIPRKIFHIAVLIWLILFAAVAVEIIAFDIQRAKAVFKDHASQHFRQADDRASINESILEGFAAMVSASRYLDRALIRRYARKMLKQYPHIYMFEIAQKVPHSELESFTEYYRRKVDPEFEVKTFGFETDRQWQPVAEMPVHMPIVFMEPFTPESRQVLGLDISSNGFFMRALEESERLDSAISSDPFELIEGGLAYLVHRPIPASHKGKKSSVGDGETRGFAVLVILADTLMDRAGHLLAGMQELLYNPSFASTDPAGYLHFHKAPPTGWLASRLFPRLSMRQALTCQSQPFVLLIEQQLGWHVISWGKLALTLLIALFTFGVVVVYARMALT